jgi:hypothetical protein
MFDAINKSLFLSVQFKFLSNIVFVITVVLILINSRYNILPLNIIILVGSIFLFHIYPNYYKVVNEHDKSITPYLMVADFIIHYMPVIYILSRNIQNRTRPHYRLCLFIVVVYLIVFHRDIFSLYFDPGIYFKRS